MMAEESAAERKRKRLEAWRKRQQQGGTTVPPPAPPAAPAAAATAAGPSKPARKVTMSLNAAAAAAAAKNKKKGRVRPDAAPARPLPPSNPFGAVDDDDGDEDDSDDEGPARRGKLSLGLGFSLEEPTPAVSTSIPGQPLSEEGDRPTKRRKKGRWDNGPAGTSSSSSINATVPVPAAPASVTFDGHAVVQSAGDALDKFMEKLEAGALGTVATQVDSSETQILSIDVGGSMMRLPKLKPPPGQPPVSGGVITSEQIAKLAVVAASATNTKSRNVSKRKEANPEALYTPSDWESDAQSTGAGGTASEGETEDDEEEEKARRAFIEALKSAPSLDGSAEGGDVNDDDDIKKPTLAAEVKSEKNRREQMLRDLEREAEEARTLAEKSGAPELGRLYNDVEGGVMEEAERNLDAAMAAPDALQVLAELNKKKELKSVDHSNADYIPFKKNLYIVPRALANLTSDQVADLRAKLKVKVRGQGAPAPVSSFEQCGLSERIMKVMEKQGITKPFPVQAQCLPCIMAGRDVIGIAKTGSGKTLAYLLPLLRHILDQPPLAPHESGPIGLILAPARELAYQIHLVCKTFTKSLGLKIQDSD